ncbi:GerMN domain-containing protein [Anaerovorax odorimutans]|uniref:GerMN domain-containing protein n=1 Tax=Anaerovorax odorimutans TaxID=109327 RepID=UPI00040E3FDA|nr:GerMN domain-containing protein [Anaerovorax odorimutans]
MKNKKILLILLCFIVAFSFMACSLKGKEADATEKKSYSAQLYFINEEYLLNGDESLDKLVKVDVSEFKAYEGEQYLDTIDTYLRSVPDGEGYETMISDNIQFNDIKVKEGTAYVDLKNEGLNGGSLEEMLLINQIVETLTNSFDEIDQVQFLVDGEVVESLMGHMDTTKPFKSTINE